MIRVALAGNPNCGKTTLFNILTGSTAHVGNWPGVTVDKREGVYKKGSELVSVIDLPGIYSLSPYTPEEVISRNYIIDEKPNCVINIVDASNLERNLYLTTQILEMDVPVIIALNMMDVLEKNKDKIDVKKLSEAIGVPVIPISALKGTNMNELMEETIKASKTKRKGSTILENSEVGPVIEKINAILIEQDVENSLYHAIKLVENDSIEVKNHEQEYKLIEEERNKISHPILGNDFEAIIADTRYKHIEEKFSIYLEKHKEPEIKGKEKLSITDKIDKVMTNKFLGLFMFVFILFLVFHLTFGEDLFYLGAIGVFKEGSDPFLAGTTWEGLLFTGSGIQSPGVFLQTCVVGLTDYLTELTGLGLESLNASTWASALVMEGIEAGLFSILSFLPQILVLFLLFSILEDSGYMARVAFLLDKIFRKFGVSGRAFMPMIMGFGCSIPAMTNTRTLSTEKERLAAVRVIPFFSCSAKLPILTAVAGAIAIQFGLGHADLITLGMYFTGIVVAIIALIFMKHTISRDDNPPFIMELPEYHLPKFTSLMLHLWDKCKHFIQKAFTVILLSNLVIWFLQRFTPSLEYIAYSQEEGFLSNLTTNDSILANLGRSLQVIFTPLGFGSQLHVTTSSGSVLSYGWVFPVAALTGLIAKENVIATFATIAAAIAKDPQVLELLKEVNSSGLASVEGATSVAQMAVATGINVPGLLSFIVFNLTTVPCFAAVATAKAEVKKGTFKNTLLFWIATSYIVSSAFYLIGTWWWTVSIYLLLIVFVILFIYLYNKNKDKQNMRKLKS